MSDALRLRLADLSLSRIGHAADVHAIRGAIELGCRDDLWPDVDPAAPDGDIVAAAHRLLEEARR